MTWSFLKVADAELYVLAALINWSLQTFHRSHRPTSGGDPKHKQIVWQNFGQLAGMLAINGFLWLSCGQNNESVMTEKPERDESKWLFVIHRLYKGNQLWDGMIFSNLWSDVSSQYIAFWIISGKVTLIGSKTNNGHFLKHPVLNCSPNFFTWQGNNFYHSCQLSSFVFWFGIMHLQLGVDWSSLLITNYTNRKSSAILIECKKCFNSLKKIHSVWKRLPTLTPEGDGRTHYHVNRSLFAANCCYHQLLFSIFCKFLSHRNRKRKSVSWTTNGSFIPFGIRVFGFPDIDFCYCAYL